MAKPILIKRSSVPDKVPTLSDLVLGELVINTVSGQVFTRKSIGGIDSIVAVSPVSTTDLAEGNNLYFTAQRAQDAVYNILGNAGTATRLETARLINGVSFDGTQDITIAATGIAAGDLVGNVLSANVTASSLTSVGVLSNLSVANEVTAGTLIAGNIMVSGDTIVSSNPVITIDPTTAGAGGLVVIAGNLQVTGTTTTINSTTVTTSELNIELAKDATNSAAANGAGITVSGANATLTYTSADDSWNLNKPLKVPAVTIGTYEAGYLTVPQNAQNTYTLILSDSGKHIFTSTGNVIWTIPSNASVMFPVGTTITFVNQSTNTCQIAINADSLFFAGTGTLGTRTLSAYGLATAIKVTATSWMISGNLT